MTRDEALRQARQIVDAGQASPARIARMIGRSPRDVAKVLRGARCCSLTYARQLVEAARQVAAQATFTREAAGGITVRALGLVAANACGIDPQSRQVAPLGYYLAATIADIPQAQLARAVGCSRQNIHKALPAIEDLRENPAIDAALEKITATLTGG